MNKKTIVTVVLMGMSVLPGLANPLQIREARQELSRLSSARIKHKEAMRRAIAAYKRIDNAYDRQKSAVKQLAKADREQVRAMYASAKHSEYRFNPYIAGNDHGSTSVRWK